MKSVRTEGNKEIATIMAIDVPVLYAAGKMTNALAETVKELGLESEKEIFSSTMDPLTQFKQFSFDDEETVSVVKNAYEILDFDTLNAMSDEEVKGCLTEAQKLNSIYQKGEDHNSKMFDLIIKTEISSLRGYYATRQIVKEQEQTNARQSSR